jgi:hypothetical protein
MRFPVLLHMVAASGFSVSAFGCGNPESPPREGQLVDQPEELLTGPPAGLPKAPRELLGGGGFYSGTVSDIGRDWVELAPGWGAWGREVNQKNNDKPKRISAAGTIPGGDADVGGGFLSFGGTHLLTDLKVGDVVEVEAGVTRAGQEWATAIDIRRRPGGKIPPMVPDQFGERPDVPERNQAYQDWEEKGTPIPAKFLKPDGRVTFTKPPYPPVAPQPRPAKP